MYIDSAVVKILVVSKLSMVYILSKLIILKNIEK